MEKTKYFKQKDIAKVVDIASAQKVSTTAIKIKMKGLIMTYPMYKLCKFM
jgi:hypothetical protein